MHMTFREVELDRAARSGWMSPAVREMLAVHGLPTPAEHLEGIQDDDWWKHAERAAAALREHFATFRFGKRTEFGLLLVPSPGKIDTRSPLPPAVRKQQSPDLGEDFVDPALGRGIDLTIPGVPWTPFVSVIGPQGISAGSHVDVRDAERRRFEVLGHDTRDAMTRQLWGARLLQSPAGTIPDSDYNDVWTFTLFPAEPLVDGKATSGTVLKGQVRFRLGKSNRGISSARVAPGIPVPWPAASSTHLSG